MDDPIYVDPKFAGVMTGTDGKDIAYRLSFECCGGRDEQYRGTGRTTALMLATISSALLNPKVSVRFKDHANNSAFHRKHQKKQLERMIVALELEMSVELIKDQLLVTSNV